jgi:hypothetical protein
VNVTDCSINNNNNNNNVTQEMNNIKTACDEEYQNLSPSYVDNLKQFEKVWYSCIYKSLI